MKVQGVQIIPTACGEAASNGFWFVLVEQGAAQEKATYHMVLFLSYFALCLILP